MSPDNVHNIPPIQPTGPASKAPGPASDSAEFRRILERLEEISGKKETTGAKKADETKEFLDAMKKADDDYTSVMDLRRKLEDAYRERQR